MWPSCALLLAFAAPVRAAESTFAGAPTAAKPGTSATTLRGERGEET